MPPFFDETYTVVPIEAVIVVIQVKTTLTASTLKDSITNLNSIVKLNAKTGGKIISAKGDLIEEKRYICPYKVIVASKTDYVDEHDFASDMKNIDIIYIVEKNKSLTVKHKKNTKAGVCENKEELIKNQSNYELEVIKESRLAFFALNLLEKMKLINNSIIINYEEYIKGAK